MNEREVYMICIWSASCIWILLDEWPTIGEEPRSYIYKYLYCGIEWIKNVNTPFQSVVLSYLFPHNMKAQLPKWQSTAIMTSYGHEKNINNIAYLQQQKYIPS